LDLSYAKGNKKTNHLLILGRMSIIITNASVERAVTDVNMIRGVAQLVARHVRDVEAASSNLVTPTEGKTLEFQQTLIFRGFFVALIPWTAMPY
jgi:hypothetical protein